MEEKSDEQKGTLEMDILLLHISYKMYTSECVSLHSTVIRLVENANKIKRANQYTLQKVLFNLHGERKTTNYYIKNVVTHFCMLFSQVQVLIILNLSDTTSIIMFVTVIMEIILPTEFVFYEPPYQI